VVNQDPMTTETTPLSAATYPPTDKQRGALKTKRDEIDSAERLPKPNWIRVKAGSSERFREMKDTVRANKLVTVCEEASCPNIGECWSKGTATFMIMGDKCTRRCRFCNVSTGRPNPLDLNEPERLAQTIALMKLNYVVITSVDRDDLRDGGAGHFVECIQHIRALTPNTYIEILTPDFGGRLDRALDILGTEPPVVLNHNIETVPRLQRAVRPSAGYARSLAVLARAKQAGLATQTSIILGMGETHDEVVATLHDLRGVGVDIVTMGQYLRPTSNHLPIDRWWHPDEFERLKHIGEALGISHVEASPLTRSSYHAKQAETAASQA